MKSEIKTHGIEGRKFAVVCRNPVNGHVFLHAQCRALETAKTEAWIKLTQGYQPVVTDEWAQSFHEDVRTPTGWVER